MDTLQGLPNEHGGLMPVVIEDLHDVQADTTELTDTGFKPKILGSAKILPLGYQVFGHMQTSRLLDEDPQLCERR